MRVSLLNAWKGRNRRVLECPFCSSRRTRYSRRRYVGLGPLFFRIRPVKCLECARYFPVAVRGGSFSRLEADELNLPFRPAELDARRGRDSSEIPPPPAETGLWGRFERRCPDCGSKDIHPSWSDMERSVFRLDARETCRCSVCNGSFSRTNLLRLTVLLLLLTGVLGAAAYAINAIRIRNSSETSPRIRQNKVPKIPPPVFR